MPLLLCTCLCNNICLHLLLPPLPQCSSLVFLALLWHKWVVYFSREKNLMQQLKLFKIGGWVYFWGCLLVCTVVSRKCFAILALVQNTGGAYTQDATFSLAITPSRCHKLWPHYQGWAQGGEMLSTLAVGWQASCSVEGRGSRTLLRSSWHVHRWCRQSMFAVDILTVDSLNLNISTAGWVFFCVCVCVCVWGGGGGGLCAG